MITWKWLAAVMVAGIVFAPFVSIAVRLFRADGGGWADFAGIIVFMIGTEVARWVQRRIEHGREVPT